MQDSVRSAVGSVDGPGEASAGHAHADCCHEHDVASKGSRGLLEAGVLLASAMGVAWLSVPTGFVGDAIVGGLAIGSVLLSGWPIGRLAWRALRRQQFDMHVLVIVAVGGALLTLQWLEAASTMWLFALSLWLEARQLERARSSVRTSMTSLQPDVAHRIVPHPPSSSTHSEARAPQTEDVPCRDLQVGDQVVVRPGERVPTDGRVVHGESRIDQSSLTGESAAVPKGPGDPLFGGSLNQDGILRIEITNTERDSLVGQIEETLRRSSSSPASMQRFMDRFARWYTPTVVAIAVVVATIPPWVESGFGAIDFQIWGGWFHRGLVLLVIACPCALLISTPFVIFSGLHRAARRGLIVKGGQFLEEAGKIDALAFDKTGTLSMGTPRLRRVVCGDSLTRSAAWGIALALERDSDHPLAQSLRVAAPADHGPSPVVHQLEIDRGFGIRGEIQGTRYVLASPRYFETNPREWSDAVALGCQEESDCSVALLADDRSILAAFFFEDSLRPEGVDALRRCRQLGVRSISILTGDRQGVACRVQNELRADSCQSDLLPLQKRDAVERFAREYPHMAFVGDGVNDAVALQAAPIGIAFGQHASQLALNVADVVVLVDNLQRVGDLLVVGQWTRRRLAQNIAFVLGLKVGAALLAVGGYAPMWLAVLADVGATLLVIGNGLRGPRW